MAVSNVRQGSHVQERITKAHDSRNSSQNKELTKEVGHLRKEKSHVNETLRFKLPKLKSQARSMRNAKVETDLEPSERRESPMETKRDSRERAEVRSDYLNKENQSPRTLHHKGPQVYD